MAKREVQTTAASRPSPSLLFFLPLQALLRTHHHVAQLPLRLSLHLSDSLLASLDRFSHRSHNYRQPPDPHKVPKPWRPRSAHRGGHRGTQEHLAAGRYRNLERYDELNFSNECLQPGRPCTCFVLQRTVRRHGHAVASHLRVDYLLALLRSHTLLSKELPV
ncbi:hypothetical protein BU25DRAFT_405439 [Macroventuria anomochaeta]|uniref:Uncharacterized protein n=1 Tax=Macroventuria anomochaeta TaxID=301207 RepID=A0ACB6SHW7_9PLEO|nr:uncharacterized protein BU25DRAFT_405439 [Macroventuria anomochaeta]KAF2633573.1 hypothetical protein BU25DRAFT_405439 [Macroventuria anomochaeta]